MPQNPILSNTALNPSNVARALRVDAIGALLTGQGQSSALGVAASTAIKVGAGRLSKVIVTTAGAAGNVYDSATVGGVGASNLIGTVPATVGVINFDFPFTNGLVYVPGTSQVASISYT